MAVSGVGSLCDGAQTRIFCFPAVRSCQQSQGLRDLTLLPASNGHIGNAAALHGLRDARSSASRFSTAICVPSSSHSIAARPHIATKPTVPISSARCRHSCSAKSKDAGNSSAEAFCQPSSGDMEGQNLRAASQNVGDVAQSSSQAGLSGAQQREETHPSRKTSAEPGRAHFKPGEVVKQSSKRSVRRRSAKEVVIDVTGESVPDSSSWRDSTSPVLRSSDISPGDPMEEGWVADTRNDARAQHWMSESSASQPLTWSGSRFLKGSSGVASAGSLDGDSSWDGRLKQTSGGGGKGGGGRGRGRSTAEGDNYGDAAANATVIVYTFLVAVLVFFWINIYIVVSKPEKIGTIGKKIAKFMSSATWRVQQLQRQKSVAAAAPLKTRYRTLTVYRSGYSRLARRLISPGPAVDVETAEGSHIDRDSAYTSMFLEVPRPQVFAHPVSLRRRSTSGSSRMATLESSPSLTSMPSAKHAPSMLGQMKSGTPFNDEGSAGVLIPLPSLRRASGTLGSVFIDESGVSGDNEELLVTPRLEPASKKSGFKTGFSSCTLETSWPTSTPMFQRHATWTGCLDVGSVGTWTGADHLVVGRTATGRLVANETDETQISSDEYRDLQKNFVGTLLPGSLTRVSLQRHSASARQDIAPHTPTPPPVTRTKSQPIESEEQQHTKQATVRKSASLHSVRDALSMQSSSKGDFLGAHHLTGDLAELS